MTENQITPMAKYQLSRSISELMGVILGISADGHLHDLEIHHLRTWLAAHPDVAATWPGSAVAAAIDTILADGEISDEERAHLLSTLSTLSGSDFADTGSVTPAPTALPVDDSVSIDLYEAGICFTGEFQCGTRSACERSAERAGSRVRKNISRNVDILVIGAQSSPDWKHSAFGRKIEDAMTLRSTGHAIAIITEQRWLELLKA